ncbi:MAG: phage head closure protein [Candidatus Riflebacteria bacterium]|nr:phage head closure protein [Candidatus Riflebacteria bacterium]
MRIGLLRKIIEIQQLVKTPDAMGGFSEQWVIYCQLYGREVIRRADTTFQAMQNQSEIQSRFETRYSDGIKPDMRLVMDNRIFQIDAVYDPSGRRERLEFICTERKAGV